MAIMDRIEHYSVSVLQTNYLDHDRQIRLSLESGATALLAFPPEQPATWLQLGVATITVYLPASQFDDVYHLLQTESPVFLTALDLFGLQIGSVHTELDLSAGEPTGEGEADIDTESLEGLIRRARAAEAAA
jgi:hypothetical protein